METGDERPFFSVRVPVGCRRWLSLHFSTRDHERHGGRACKRSGIPRAQWLLKHRKIDLSVLQGSDLSGLRFGRGVEHCKQRWPFFATYIHSCRSTHGIHLLRCLEVNILRLHHHAHPLLSTGALLNGKSTSYICHRQSQQAVFRFSVWCRCPLGRH